MRSDAFSDLPDALVRDLLAEAEVVAQAVDLGMQELVAGRSQLREMAASQHMILRKADLDVPRDPTVVGIDGSYNVHHLTSTDICAAAALGVEGVIREERRHWEQPYHRFWAAADTHAMEATQNLRGVMVAMELELIGLAPHDLVLMDGSFLSLVIYLNQGLSAVNGDLQVGRKLTELWRATGLESLLAVLGSSRVVAVPKFTSRNELARVGIASATHFDARTLSTCFLQPGEYTSPLQIVTDLERPYHLAGLSNAENTRLDQAVRQLQVVFYRPYGWAPAMRIECPPAITNSPSRLSMLLQGLQQQLFSPAVLEPYPLFLADRMVKSLGAGLEAIEHTVLQQVAANTEDIELTMLCLQNFRTEGGS